MTEDSGLILAEANPIHLEAGVLLRGINLPGYESDLSPQSDAEFKNV